MKGNVPWVNGFRQAMGCHPYKSHPTSDQCLQEAINTGATASSTGPWSAYKLRFPSATTLLTAAEARAILTPVGTTGGNPLGCFSSCVSETTADGQTRTLCPSCPDPRGAAEPLQTSTSALRQAASDYGYGCPAANPFESSNPGAARMTCTPASSASWPPAGFAIPTSQFPAPSSWPFFAKFPNLGVCQDAGGNVLFAGHGQAYPLPELLQNGVGDITAANLTFPFDGTNLADSIPPFFICEHSNPTTEATVYTDLMITNISFYEAHQPLLNKILPTTWCNASESEGRCYSKAVGDKFFPGGRYGSGGFASINMKVRCMESDQCGSVANGEYCSSVGINPPYEADGSATKNGERVLGACNPSPVPGSAEAEPFKVDLRLYTKASCCADNFCQYFYTRRDRCPSITYQRFSTPSDDFSDPMSPDGNLQWFGNCHANDARSGAIFGGSAPYHAQVPVDNTYNSPRFLNETSGCPPLTHLGVSDWGCCEGMLTGFSGVRCSPSLGNLCLVQRSNKPVSWDPAGTGEPLSQAQSAGRKVCGTRPQFLMPLLEIYRGAVSLDQDTDGALERNA